MTGCGRGISLRGRFRDAGFAAMVPRTRRRGRVYAGRDHRGCDVCGGLVGLPTGGDA